MLQQEDQQSTRRVFSLRSVLLIALVVAAGVVATAFALGLATAAGNIFSIAGQLMQSTSNSATTSTTAHHCNQTQASLRMTSA